MTSKKYIAILLVIFIVLSNFAIFVSAEDNAYTIKHKPITITYNGRQIDCGEQPPALVGGRTMVPLRAVFEHMGCTVSFENGNISAIRGNEEVKLSLGSTEAMVIRSGKTEKFTLDEPPAIINGRTLVPVRFMAEAIGCKINWNPIMREAVIIDVSEWKEKMKNEAPVMDAIFSSPIEFEESSASKKSGEISFSFNFNKIKDYTKNKIINANIGVKITFDGKTQIANGKKNLEYVLWIEFTGLKSYANKLSDSKQKEFLIRLSDINKIVLNAVLDEEYNLYISGDGFNKLMSVCGVHAGDVLEKTLKIPAGQILSDLTAMPLGTILCNGSIWDGIDKAVSEDDTMFTQRVKLLDDFINLTKNSFGFGITNINESKGHSKTYQFALDKTEFNEYITDKAESNEAYGNFNLKISKSLSGRSPYCNAKIVVKDDKIKNSDINMSYGLNMVQEDDGGKTFGEAAFSWKLKLYGESVNENKTVNVPENYMEYNDFINSDGKVLHSFFE